MAAQDSGQDAAGRKLNPWDDRPAQADAFIGERIGVIGVGMMGRPVVERLKARGFDVAVYVRREELKAEMAAKGVTVAPDLQSLAKGRDIILSYVYTDEQTREVALDDGLVDMMEPGSILVIHTTGSPKTVQAVGERGKARGVGVVDAGGAWGPTYTVHGEMNLMVGGEPEQVERCMPVFETYAYPIHHMGPLGAGMCMKLINNAVIGCHMQLAFEVTRIGRELGLDSYRLLRGLSTCTGGSTAMRLMAGGVTPERFWASIGRFLYKDVAVVYDVAEQLNLDLGLIGEMNDNLMKRLEKEHGH